MNLLKDRGIYVAAVAGLWYGLLLRLVFTFEKFDRVIGFMTIGFLMVMPMAVGFISVYIAVRAGRRGLGVWLGLPVLTTLTLIVSCLVLFWEGAICLIMLTPIAVVMAMLGGGLGAFCARRFGKTSLLCVAILPFVVSATETRIGPRWEEREVKTSISIHASPNVVWEHIKRVEPIRVEEQRFSWSQQIGFPRPIEATLSADGIGGVRHATFAGGVLFVETITLWQPEQRLAFEIKADTANIPPRTLDEHVTIGGPYFDALYGEYRIEPQRDGRTLLHLVSRHRLSTTLNFYAGIWTSAVMRDIQENILYVIRNRCEQ